MTKLTTENFRRAFSEVNAKGFSSLDLSKEILPHLGIDLYSKMDKVNFHKKRTTYYNEIAFYWPEDWADVEEGIGAFHEQKSLKDIMPYTEASILLKSKFGEQLTADIFQFTTTIKNLTIANHMGLANNELRLSRVILRQMNENDRTTHGGSDFHEDLGYDDRPYQHLLSVIVTTYGIPTEALKYAPRVGELLLFNAFDRRRLMGQGGEFAFIHKGPESGPKMFFFFEFLGPRDHRNSIAPNTESRAMLETSG